MALLGPMVVIAEQSAGDLIEILGKAGAFPIVEASWRNAPDAIGEIAPAALAIADAVHSPEVKHLNAVARAIEAAGGPFTPIVARVTPDSGTPLLGALPIDIDEPEIRLVARVRSALRVRTLHATALRRASAAGMPTAFAPAILRDDLLEEATVLCVGRGRAYPDLSVAIGERVGVVGSLSIEAAARCLGTRDIDGIVIGDGFSARMVNALLIAVAEDAGFRDLPVAVLGGAVDPAMDDRLPNLIRVESDATMLVERLLPFLRLQALEGRLKRMLKTLDSKGLVDPVTGLMERGAFWRDLEHAATDAVERGSALSVARIAFEAQPDRRTSLDAARLLARLVRDVDVACRDEDGSVLIAFTETDLRAAHVVARRLATTIRQTIATPERDRKALAPTVTLATLKPKDNLYSMMARISAFPQVAAS